MPARPPRRRPPDDDASAVDIDALLKGEGFVDAASRRKARAVLESAGLTRPGKRGMASYKRQDARDALARAIVRVCSPGCAALAEGQRVTVRIAPATRCDICGGSNNRRAVLGAARTLREAGVRRLLVVGGSPAIWRELTDLFRPLRIEVQCVDGTARSHGQREALANMNRAQLMVIWGSTPLRHAVSNQYTAEPPPHLRRITVPRRSIEALCHEIERSYAAPAGRRMARR